VPRASRTGVIGPAAIRRVRRSTVAACAAALLALGCAPAAVAAGLNGNKAFGELATPSAQTPTTTTATTRNASNTESTSSSRTLILVVAGAAVLLLTGIGFVIVRDARRVAPATEADALGGRSGRDNTARHAKRRAQAKAARQQRKRNR
jgi:hypothetical protein